MQVPGGEKMTTIDGPTHALGPMPAHRAAELGNASRLPRPVRRCVHEANPRSVVPTLYGIPFPGHTWGETRTRSCPPFELPTYKFAPLGLPVLEVAAAPATTLPWLKTAQSNIALHAGATPDVWKIRSGSTRVGVTGKAAVT